MSSLPLLSAQEPLGQLIQMGGPVMIVLIAMALIGSVAFFYLILTAAFFAPRANRSAKQLVKEWQQKRHSAAVSVLQDNEGWFARLNPLYALLSGVMQGLSQGQPPETVRERANDNLRRALSPFEAPLKIMEVVAALAPLLGLLGTVLGMMDAFSTMASAEARASATQLSGGIYQALTTTAAGLVVAIPFAALAAWSDFRLRRLYINVDELLVRLFTQDPTSDNPDQYTAPEITTAPARSFEPNQHRGHLESEAEAGEHSDERRQVANAIL